jgi:YHS domain-containing protein
LKGFERLDCRDDSVLSLLVEATRDVAHWSSGAIVNLDFSGAGLSSFRLFRHRFAAGKIDDHFLVLRRLVVGMLGGVGCLSPADADRTAPIAIGLFQIKERWAQTCLLLWPCCVGSTLSASVNCELRDKARPTRTRSPNSALSWLGHSHRRSGAGPEVPTSTGEARWTPPAKDVDPVCGMTIETAGAKSTIYEGHAYYFCSPTCREKFDASPRSFMSGEVRPPQEMEHSHERQH